MVLFLPIFERIANHKTMKTKIDIQKILKITKKTSKQNGSFDEALIGLGVKINSTKKSK
jgi:hypothetical protein